MIWPVEMGGGYHFTKLEGRYKLPGNGNCGYAVHLGTNNMLMLHNKLDVSLGLKANSSDTLFLTMNINEWFTNPNTYNFLVQGNYTMGNDTLMLMLKENAKDLFKIGGH